MLSKNQLNERMQKQKRKREEKVKKKTEAVPWKINLKGIEKIQQLKLQNKTKG